MWNANAKLLKNNGDNTFTAEQGDTFEKLIQASAVFIDYDNDGDLDLITMGRIQDGANTANVYENTGAENGYVFVKNEALSNHVKSYAVNTGSGNSVGRLIQAVDYDHDGWVDLLVSGDANYNVYDWDPGANSGSGGWGWLWGHTCLFKNENGIFAHKDNLVVDGENHINFAYTRKGSIHVGDVNSDGYADFLAQGWNDQQGWIARLYINNQDGTFTVSPYSSQLQGSEEYESIFADLNNDGYDDIVEIARAVANIHVNDQQGGFTKRELSETGLIMSWGASITAGDINNNGWIDLLVSGINGDEGDLGLTKIFYNNGDLTFSAIDVPDIMRARSGAVALVDINNDGNLDYANTGYKDGWNTAFAINTLAKGSIASNIAPSVPSALEVTYANGKYSLSWTAATDTETPVAALRYNVYTHKIGADTTFVYAPVDTLTNKLKIGGDIVPLIHSTSFELNLPEAAYSFGVQAVDQADVTGAFVNYVYIPIITDIQLAALNDRVNVISNKGLIEIRNTASSGVQYAILSVNGQTLKSGSISAGTQFTSNRLNPGVYLVKLTQEGNSYIQKVVVF
jgi:hypothetical protein